MTLCDPDQQPITLCYSQIPPAPTWGHQKKGRVAKSGICCLQEECWKGERWKPYEVQYKGCSLTPHIVSFKIIFSGSAQLYLL